MTGEAIHGPEKHSRVPILEDDPFDQTPPHTGFLLVFHFRKPGG